MRHSLFINANINAYKTSKICHGTDTIMVMDGLKPTSSESCITDIIRYKHWFLTDFVLIAVCNSQQTCECLAIMPLCVTANFCKY